MRIPAPIPPESAQPMKPKPGRKKARSQVINLKADRVLLKEAGPDANKPLFYFLEGRIIGRGKGRVTLRVSD